MIKMIEAIHKAVKIIRAELDVRKFVQNVFNFKKAMNPEAL